MKLTYLKKLLIKIGIVCTIIVLLTIGMYVGASQYMDYSTQERDRAQGQATGVIGENATLKDRIAKSSESYSIYEKIIRYNKLGDFSLNREAASKLLNQLKTQYPVTNLNVSIAPVKELTTEAGKKKTGKVVYSEVRIAFDASTDTTAFNFIRALATQFPGFVSYQSVKLTKKMELTSSIFQDISANHIPELVTADVTFNWLGIRANPENPATTPGAPSGSPGTPPGTPPGVPHG